MYKEIEITSKVARPWWWWLWLPTKWVGKFIWLVLSTLAILFIVEPASALWKSFREGVHKMLVGAMENIGKMLGKLFGYMLVIMLVLSFVANNFSIGRTFSWDGLLTLWETFK